MSTQVHPPRRATSELVQWVPIERLQTSLAALRSPVARPQRDDLAALPLRAVVMGDALEVVDGFKRLERWRTEGRLEVPVVVERAQTFEEAHVLLLRANAPRRTTSVMDEARVVVALLARPNVGPSTVARLLGRRTGWVRRRRDLAMRLVASVQRRLDMGAIRPTVAEALTRVPGREQERIVRAIEVHGLKAREARALVAAHAALGSEEERAALLQDPLAWVRRPPRASPLGPLAEELAGQLRRFQRALSDLATFELPSQGLSDAERRRLAAEWRAVAHQLRETQVAVSHDPEEDRRVQERERGSGTTAAGGPGELADAERADAERADAELAGHVGAERADAELAGHVGAELAGHVGDCGPAVAGGSTAVAGGSTAAADAEQARGGAPAEAEGQRRARTERGAAGRDRAAGGRSGPRDAGDRPAPRAGP